MKRPSWCHSGMSLNESKGWETLVLRPLAAADGGVTSFTWIVVEDLRYCEEDDVEGLELEEERAIQVLEKAVDDEAEVVADTSNPGKLPMVEEENGCFQMACWLIQYGQSPESVPSIASRAHRQKHGIGTREDDGNNAKDSP